MNFEQDLLVGIPRDLVFVKAAIPLGTVAFTPCSWNLSDIFRQGDCMKTELPQNYRYSRQPPRERR